MRFLQYVEALHLARADLKAWQGHDRDNHVLSTGRAGRAEVRAFAQWVLAYGSHSSGEGSSFDRPYLDLYDRCH